MSIFGKLGRYGVNRFQPENVRNAWQDSIRGGARQAASAFRPAPLDRADVLSGYKGRYNDGGVERFREMVSEAGLTASDLAGIEANHARASSVFFGTSAGFVILAVALVLIGSGMMSFLGMLICVIFAAGSLARAIQSDFAAWQVKRRRFDGFEAYLKTRFLSG